MLIIVDTDKLHELLGGATAKSKGTVWEGATNRAVAALLEARNVDGMVRLVGPEAIVRGRSGPYIVGPGEKTCSCPAGRHGRACWHRAAVRIIRRAVEVGAVVDLKAVEVEEEELFA